MQQPTASRVLRFSELSPQRQMLVRLCQQANYGSIRGLEINDGEPSFNPAPVVQVDLKLDGDDPPRPESKLEDFELSREVVRLLERIDDSSTAMIELLDVRAGIPRRAVFRAAFKHEKPATDTGADVSPESRR